MWALVGLVALVPLAAIGMFVLGGSHSTAPRPVDAAPQIVPVAVDAGVVIVDAQPVVVAPPLDAAIAKPKRSDTNVHRPPPPPRVDAGVKKPRPDASAEPNIDFYP